MKLIKPQRIGLLQRVVEHRRRCTLVVSAFAYVSLEAPRKLLSDVSLWKDVAEHVPGGILDEGFPKPAGEVLVSGAGHAPSGRAVTALYAHVVLGKIDKKLAVQGDRYWKGGTASQPEPFERMPIDWAHAFGGEGYPQNPLGKGIAPTQTDKGPAHLLPNVEDPKALVVSPKDRPLPAGFGAYSIEWPQRFEKMGRQYDQRWLEALFPGPAEDFDAHFYNVAPADQRTQGFFAGDEAYLLEGMHPTRPKLEGKLEKLVVRAFATQRDSTGESFRTIATHLDTVHFLPHLGRAVLVFRGTLPVAEDDADDIEHLVVAAEDPSHPRAIEHYQEVLRLRLDKDKGGIASLRDQELMPPAAEGWETRFDVGDVGELYKFEMPGLANAERGRKRKEDLRRAKLSEAGFDPDAGVEPLPASPAVPDPYDPDTFQRFVDDMNELGAKLKAKAETESARAQAEAREKLTAAGYDYDAEVAKARAAATGPPKFSADEHLGMLHDMVRISHEGNAPLTELEQQLTDPRYEEMLRALEAQTIEGYRRMVHLMPAAGALDGAQSHVHRVRCTAAKEAGESLAGRNLTGADLSGLDLDGMDLSGALLESANLAKTTLRGANLSAAVLARANLDGADLSGARLCDTNVGDATLVGTNLSNTILEGTVFARSRLDRARFEGARLRNVDFFETVFGAADLSHIDAFQIMFLRIDLSKASFPGARWVRCVFVECNVSGADFTGADLTQAQFITAMGNGATFTGATMASTVFAHGSSLEQCKFDGAVLGSSNFRKTSLVGSTFERAQLDGSDLSKCDLTGANLSHIRARGALFIRTNFTGADLRGADLLGAIVQKAILHGADLRGANLARADLSLVRVDGATKVSDALMLDTRVDPKHEP